MREAAWPMAKHSLMLRNTWQLGPMLSIVLIHQIAGSCAGRKDFGVLVKQRGSAATGRCTTVRPCLQAARMQGSRSRQWGAHLSRQPRPMPAECSIISGSRRAPGCVSTLNAVLFAC